MSSDALEPPIDPDATADAAPDPNSSQPQGQAVYQATHDAAAAGVLMPPAPCCTTSDASL